jgi:hypothetical protein
MSRPWKGGDGPVLTLLKKKKRRREKHNNNWHIAGGWR